VSLRTATGGDVVLAAKRVVVRFSPWTLGSGHVDLVLLDRPLVTPRPSVLPVGTPGGSRRTWSIDRLVARHGRFVLRPDGELPGVSFRFALDLRDLGSEPARAERSQRIPVKDLELTAPDRSPLLAMRGGTVHLSLAGLLERGRIDEVRLLAPQVTITGVPPAFAGGDAASAAGVRPLTLGSLVVRDGRFRMPAAADRPGVAFRFSADMHDVGTGAAEAALPRDVTLRAVSISLADGAPVLAMDALRAQFTIAGLRAKHIDEVALKAPVVGVPATVPAARGAPGGSGTTGGWTIGRLHTHDGRLGIQATETLPNVSGAFAFDLKDLGTDEDRAARLHRVRMHGLRVRFAHRPTSLVLDDASVTFSTADLLRRGRLAKLRIDGGLLVLDRALRDQLAAAEHGAAPSRTAWSLGVLDVSQLGLRLSGLGAQIPDITLLIHSRLTDVPLGAASLAKARTPQRLELADLTLDSPLDPFRPVVHVGGIFVEFTIAGLLEHQLSSIAVVSPTIYLGEDLIWYMNTTRGGASAAQQPWTVRALRADLGKIVVTFEGVNRASLPLNFRTDARNVTLGDLASLRLAAALEVPNQNYTFPGLDLELIGVQGELRFDYPPGQATDNVVNTLSVDAIRWRDYVVRHGWLAATFDEKGINGRLGGSAYDGYVNGGASVPFGPGPMSGWAAATDLDLAPIAATVGGPSFEMTGQVDVEGAVEALNGEIDRARAELAFERPGELSIPALDRLLDKLPPDTASWQRDLARIAVETFRDFPYATGSGTLTFADHRGEAHLGLSGARGKRQFDIHYYEDVPAVAQTARDE
jgi:hypothetical protein